MSRTCLKLKYQYSQLQWVNVLPGRLSIQRSGICMHLDMYDIDRNTMALDLKCTAYMFLPTIVQRVDGSDYGSH